MEISLAIGIITLFPSPRKLLRLEGILFTISNIAKAAGDIIDAARNFGASLASSKWIAFLDSKTVPNSNWLKMTLEKAISKNAYLVFGKTKYGQYLVNLIP